MRQLQRLMRRIAATLVVIAATIGVGLPRAQAQALPYSPDRTESVDAPAPDKMDSESEGTDNAVDEAPPLDPAPEPAPPSVIDEPSAEVPVDATSDEPVPIPAPASPSSDGVEVETAILGTVGGMDNEDAVSPAPPELVEPSVPSASLDEHDAPENPEVEPSAPSAFWLDGTSRTRSDDRSGNDEDIVASGTGKIPVPDPTTMGPPAPDPDANEFGVSPMSILDHIIAPATRERLTWTTGQSFSGSVMETPVIVVHGIKPGPRLCLTAGVHGDELNGVEVVRRLAYKIEPDQLAGTVIAVPIVNLLGFSRGTRYLPDRRDLNRFFPGSPNGSSASRIAHSFFSAIIDHCDALVDFHTGSLDRANLPQVRGDLTIPSVVEFTRGFGATAVLHSPGALGMLRYAASTHGVPSVTFEIGGPMRLQPEEIEHGEQAIETLMHKMGMVERRRRWDEPQAVFYESTWVRVDQGGMLFSEVKLGDRVTAGQRLGRVIDPVSNRSAEILVPEDGRVIGMALNQLVLPGFAAYHLGVAASEERVVNEAEQNAAPDDERFLEYDQLDEDGGPDAGEPASETNTDQSVAEPREED